MTTHQSLPETAKTSDFQNAIEVVEALPLEDQEVLIDILAKRIRQQHRDDVLKSIAEAEQDYADGNVRRGSIADLMAELDEECR
ncbi:MAG: hypothetical protein LH660_17645 [Phormidesmis sp. CAN_BIN36]|nr:hypothetical protein [Phormidesmis sp. CAN_BIN36]